MATFVHIADIHVGMGFGSASFSKYIGNERRLEIKETLYKVIEYCETNKIDLLLIAGDLFEEGEVSISDLKDMNHHFSTLTHTKVLISGGNHDPIVDKNANYNLIQWCEQVYLFGTKMTSFHFEELMTEVHSFSWDKMLLPALKEEMLALVCNESEKEVMEERTHILMLHGDVYSQSDYLYIDKRMVALDNFDYIALGHIHAMDFVKDNMAYSGSLEPLDFSETGDHGFIEGSIEKGQLDVSFKAFAKRTFHVLDVIIDGTMSYERIKEEISRSINECHRENLFRVVLRGDLDPDVILDVKELQNHFMEKVHYIEFQNETLPDLDLEALKTEFEGSLVGDYIAYIESLDEEEEVKTDALYQGLRIMLREQVKK